MAATDNSTTPRTHNPAQLTQRIKAWGRELGFQQVGITDTDLDEAERHLLNWLDHNYHGEMSYMQRHGERRSRPQQLVPGTTRVISVRMNYFPAAARPIGKVLNDPEAAFVSRYALGRDYHKLMRRRLQRLADRIERETGRFAYRAFSDSAPVLEKALAEKAGLGWIGKHSNLLSREAGSWFFLGELYTDLPLLADTPASNYCGSCRACIDACPTGAIVAPYTVDARRCISYLTIELKGDIPEALRPLIGNRIYGCDDCQLVCPWNREAACGEEPAFQARHNLDSATLVKLAEWSETEFIERTEGSAIRRIGYTRWLRNIVVALGNAPTDASVLRVLRRHAEHSSAMVREHARWGLRRHGEGADGNTNGAAPADVHLNS